MSNLCACGSRHRETVCVCGAPVTDVELHRRWARANPEYHEELVTARKRRRAGGLASWRKRQQEIRALDAARALAKAGAGQDEACDRCHSPIKMRPNRDRDPECPLCGNVRYTIPPDVAEEVADGIRSHAPRLPGE